jgi:hypothetical protein
MGHNSGGLLGTALDVVGDVAAGATGQEWAIPLINTAVSTGTGLASGEGIGKALTQGAISGGETLIGQEAAGALGIGQGNTAFNSALGITGDNPAGTGLPDLGNLFGGASNTPGATTGVASSSGATPGAITTTAAGSPVAAGAAPVASTPSSGSFTAAADIGPEAQAAIGSQAASTGLTGTSTTGSPNLGSLAASDVSSGPPDISPGTDTTPVAWPAPTATATGGAPSGFPSPQSAAGGIGAASPAGGVDPQAVDAALAGTPVGGTAPAAGTAAGTGAGGSGLLGTYGKYAASAIPIGELAYQAIKGPSALPSASQALEAGGAVTAPLLATETQSLNDYNSGTLTAPQQAGVTEYIQQQRNQLIQQLANEGVTNFAGDSRYISGMAAIQQNALALTQSYLNASLNAGMSAAGGAGSNLANVAQQQLSQDQQFQSSLTGALTSLGSIVGGSSGINISVAK